MRDTKDLAETAAPQPAPLDQRAGKTDAVAQYPASGGPPRREGGFMTVHSPRRECFCQNPAYLRPAATGQLS